MSEGEAGEWKTRLKSYENTYQLMQNPTEELLYQVRSEITTYLSDPNQVCQRTALSICDQYFKKDTEIDYIQIAEVLIDKCIGQ